MSRRAGAIAFAAMLAVASCQPGPSTPAGTASNSPPSTGFATVPPASTGTGAGTGLAEALRDAISVDDIVADLAKLDGIASANHGNRSAGSPGHETSVTFVADE